MTERVRFPILPILLAAVFMGLLGAAIGHPLVIAAALPFGMLVALLARGPWRGQT